MTTVFSNKGNKIIKDKDGLYTLESSNSLFLSFLSGTLPNIVRSNLSSIDFKGESVMSLTQLLSHNKHGLSYETVESMMRMLIEQVRFFEQNGFGLLFLAPEDIIVIGNQNFVLFNTDLFKKREKDMLSIDRPYKKDDFSPPDFLSVKTLPYRLFYKSGYYSIGAVAVYSLFKEYMTDKVDIDEALLPIVQTPLYWFIKRVLHKEPKERFLILL